MIEDGQFDTADVYITPPDGEATDEDSGDEDGGGMVDNLSRDQLRAEAEASIRSNRYYRARIGLKEKDLDEVQGKAHRDVQPGEAHERVSANSSDNAPATSAVVEATVLGSSPVKLRSRLQITKVNYSTQSTARDGGKKSEEGNKKTERTQTKTKRQLAKSPARPVQRDVAADTVQQDDDSSDEEPPAINRQS